MIVVGNVGSDSEMRYVPSGTAVTSFTLATNRRYRTSSGEQREETEWFTVTAWGRLAETVNQYVTKGMKVYAEGRLKSSTWKGNDGQTRFRNEITATDIVFLDSRGAGSSNPVSADNIDEVGQVQTQATPPPSQEDDNLPSEELPW
jgi:single-strand DNA-binding protein|tara:strand:+ start:279 stop:716 length:438 start_codon:yes stop_codon:yes gene_type:complete